MSPPISAVCGILPALMLVVLDPLITLLGFGLYSNLGESGEGVFHVHFSLAVKSL